MSAANPERERGGCALAMLATAPTAPWPGSPARTRLAHARGSLVGCGCGARPAGRPPLPHGRGYERPARAYFFSGVTGFAASFSAARRTDLMTTSSAGVPSLTAVLATFTALILSTTFSPSITLPNVAYP